MNLSAHNNDQAGNPHPHADHSDLDDLSSSVGCPHDGQKD